jgi:hypothetical protein
MKKFNSIVWENEDTTEKLNIAVIGDQIKLWTKGDFHISNEAELKEIFSSALLLLKNSYDFEVYDFYNLNLQLKSGYYEFKVKNIEFIIYRKWRTNYNFPIAHWYIKAKNEKDLNHPIINIVEKYKFKTNLIKYLNDFKTIKTDIENARGNFRETNVWIDNV